MDPRWLVPDSPVWMFRLATGFVELLKKHHKFQSVAIGFAGPVLVADILFRFWCHLPETSNLKRMLMTVFHKAPQLASRCLPYLVSCACLMAAVVLVPAAAVGSFWDAFSNVFGLIALTWSGVVLAYSETGDSRRTLAVIIFSLSMLISTAHLLSIGMIMN